MSYSLYLHSWLLDLIFIYFEKTGVQYFFPYLYIYIYPPRQNKLRAVFITKNKSCNPSLSQLAIGSYSVPYLLAGLAYPAPTPLSFPCWNKLS
jgi:hypothetical protein